MGVNNLNQVHPALSFIFSVPKSKKFIKKAMRHIENNTCIRFRQKKLRDDDYIRFISEPG